MNKIWRHPWPGPFPTDGQVDPDIIDVGRQTIAELDRTSDVSSADSVAMMYCRRKCVPGTGADYMEELE